MRVFIVGCTFVVLLAGCRRDGNGDLDRSVDVLDVGVGELPPELLFPTRYGTVTAAQLGPRFLVDGREVRRSTANVGGPSPAAEAESWTTTSELGLFLVGTGSGFVDEPLFLVPTEARDGFTWEQTVTDTLTWRGTVQHDEGDDVWIVERGFDGYPSERVEYRPGVGRGTLKFFAADGLQDPEPPSLPDAVLQPQRGGAAPHLVGMTVFESTGDELLGEGIAHAVEVLNGVRVDVFDGGGFELDRDADPRRTSAERPLLERDDGRFPPGRATAFEWRDHSWRLRAAPYAHNLGRRVGPTPGSDPGPDLQTFGAGALERLAHGRRYALGALELGEDEFVASAWFLPDGSVQGVLSTSAPGDETSEGDGTWFRLPAPVDPVEIPETPTVYAVSHGADVELCWTGELERLHDSWTLGGRAVAGVIPTRPACLLLVYAWEDGETSVPGPVVAEGWLEGFGNIHTESPHRNATNGYPTDQPFSLLPGHVIASIGGPPRCVPDQLDPDLCYERVGDQVMAHRPDSTVSIGSVRDGRPLLSHTAGGVVAELNNTNDLAWLRVDEAPFVFTPDPWELWRDTLDADHYCTYVGTTTTCYAVPTHEVVGEATHASPPVLLQGHTFLVAPFDQPAERVELPSMTSTPLGFTPPPTGYRGLGDGAARGWTDAGVVRLDAEGWVEYRLPERESPIDSPAATHRTVADAYGVYAVTSRDTYRYPWAVLEVVDSGP